MFVEESNEEWRQWIKLIEKKGSISSTSLRDSAIDLLVTQVAQLQEEASTLKEENKTLQTKLFLHEMDRERLRKKGYLDE